MPPAAISGDKNVKCVNVKTAGAVPPPLHIPLPTPFLPLCHFPNADASFNLQDSLQSPTQTPIGGAEGRLGGKLRRRRRLTVAAIFLAQHFHIHESKRDASNHHHPPLSLFSLSQLDFQHFYASKMLRCLLRSSEGGKTGK